MRPEFPTAEEYSSQKARHAPMADVDIRAEQADVTDACRNQVLLDVNTNCMRLSVFQGEYHWHHHPDSDELFLVVAGELHIDFEDGNQATLREWQSMVVPAGKVHRTRATGRTVNVTFEKQCAATVFVEPSEPLRNST